MVNVSRFRSLAMGALALVLMGGSAVADENWTVDFEEAKAVAAKEGKSILMEFTGSDWCPPCISFHKNVLSKEIFLTEAPKNYVLLKLDNPRDKSKQTPEEIAQYQELSKKYKVSGVPTVILADEQGRPYAKMVGYGGTTAEQYVAQLSEKAGVLAQRNEVLAKAEQADGIEKAKLLDQVVGLVGTELALSLYPDTVKEIIALDAEDQAGLKGKYSDLLNAEEVKGKLEEIVRGARGNPEEAIAKIDQLITDSGAAGASLQQILFMKANLVYRNDRDAAKQLLVEAYKAAPESDQAKQISQVLQRVFSLDPEKLQDEQ